MPSYEASAKGYAAMWAKATLTRRAAALSAAKRALDQWDHYARGAERLGHPDLAPLIAAIHYREADLNLHGCLANGDSAVGTGRKTTNVPAGLGPYNTFEDSCYDAWRHEGFLGIKDWPLPRWLWAAEKFNGWGYVSRGINAPYDWAGTSLEQPGKYVSDGRFVSSVHDAQLGVVAVLKALFELKPDLAPKSTPVATTSVTGAVAGAVVATTAVASGSDGGFVLGVGVGVIYLIATWILQNHKENGTMSTIFSNPMTSLAGLAALLTGAGTVISQISSGHPIDPTIIGQLATTLFAAFVGLAAKDGNK